MTFKYICPKCGYENVREYPATRIVCDKCLCVFKPNSSNALAKPVGEIVQDRLSLPLEKEKVSFKPFSPSVSTIERKILNRGPGC